MIVLNCALISLDLTVGPTRLWARYLAVSFTLVLLAVFIRQTIGWVGRRRSAGGLLLDMSTERGYRLAVRVTLFCMAASISIQFICILTIFLAASTRSAAYILDSRISSKDVAKSGSAAS